LHYLQEAAKPISEADRHAKQVLKKSVRGERPIIPQLAQAQRAIMARRRSRSATLWGTRSDRPTGWPVVGDV
jgi:hypothetical protein